MERSVKLLSLVHFVHDDMTDDLLLPTVIALDSVQALGWTVIFGFLCRNLRHSEPLCEAVTW